MLQASSRHTEFEYLVSFSTDIGWLLTDPKLRTEVQKCAAVRHISTVVGWSMSVSATAALLLTITAIDLTIKILNTIICIVKHVRSTERELFRRQDMIIC